MTKKYQICTKCVMDTTDPDIHFDSEGVCNHCHEYDKVAKVLLYSDEEKKEKLDRLISEIKEAGKGKDYDCIIGLSGGVDSSYLAYCAKELGLRPLAVHLDNGWNSELAVKNIENIVKKLDIDLYTYVVDWEEFKDLQLSYLKASVVDIEVVTDNAIFVILDRISKEHKVKYFLSGTNFATENVMPQSWFYVNKVDSKNIKAIHKKFGTSKNLKSYPLFSTFEFLKYSYFNNVKTIPLLNYLPYNKAEAMQFLKEKLDWRDYGGKHWESKFTQFYQVYILPKKFGIDKRRAHISSLVLSGQITREEALKEIEKELYDESRLNDDVEYMLKKFNISREEFDKLMAMPPVSHDEYPSFKAVRSKLSKLKSAVLKK